MPLRFCSHPPQHPEGLGGRAQADCRAVAGKLMWAVEAQARARTRGPDNPAFVAADAGSVVETPAPKQAPPASTLEGAESSEPVPKPVP